MTTNLAKIAGLYSSLSIPKRRDITEQIVLAGLMFEYGQKYNNVFRSMIYKNIGITKRIYIGLHSMTTGEFIKLIDLLVE